jgi:hypothetical protein
VIRSTTLPAHRSETNFRDFKLPLMRDGAMATAKRCLFCGDALVEMLARAGVAVQVTVRRGRRVA